MKTPKFLLAILAGCAISTAVAEVIPTHDAYVMPFSDGYSKAFPDYFRTWEPGTQLSEDENFYIARVPMKKRFVNTATQVDPTMTQDRKFCMWTPMGVADTYWQSLPRGVFDGDNFSMWSYVDTQGGWSLPWVRVPGAYADVTHKNGVGNCGGLIFFDSWGGDNRPAQAIVDMMVEKDGTKFKWVEKFVKYLRYYGLDGIGCNPEGPISNASLFQDFLAECRTYAESIGWQFHVYWYGTNTNGGTMDLGNELTSGKANWFRKNGKQVTDMYMLNYGANGGTSISTCNSLGGNTYDIYVGYDIQGQWLQGRASWANLKSKPLSFVFWGNHTTNMIYQNSTEFGSGDEAVQYCYLDKQEQVFSGGKRNPANRPAIYEGQQSSSYAAMEKFHGIAEFLPARSVLQELPFVTRFGLGNGKAFYNEGQVTFDKKWFNVGVQDYLPTWRWWITDNSGNVPTDAIDCGFTFEDAWFAGSAMEVQGATKVSNVRLFKTKFAVSATDDISLTYKVKAGTQSNMELFWSFVGSESTLHYAAIGAAKAGEWVTFSKKAQEIGMNGNVAMIGIRFTNTPANYNVLLGEFSIINAESFAPVKPSITTTANNIIKKHIYNAVDVKFSWNVAAPAGHASHTDKYVPVYNEDVDTWYYEVYVQEEGKEPVLCGTTSQWAHYVVGAPATDDPASKYRVGVCAVAPDGKTKSAIAWSGYQTKEVTLVNGIQNSKAVIKSGEEFTLSFVDPNQEEAFSWEIINATKGGNAVKAQDGGTSFTTSLTEEGYYDVKVTNSNFEEFIYRGYVQISPASTGAIPSITDFTASSTNVDASVNPEVTLSYTGNKNEGTVSRGLEVNDPYMFRIPKAFLPNSQSQYSIALWIKPTKFSFAKYGMGLIQQRNMDISWPHNNWGAIWVDVWPEQKNSAGNKILDQNIVSYAMYLGGTASSNTWYSSSYYLNGNGNVHEVPNLACCTDGHLSGSESYSLSENNWSHILISFDGSKQRIYFNGKKVAERSGVSKKSYTGGESNIYIGGSRVYFAGFTGVIDDVQVWHKALSDTEVTDAMKGYYGRETQIPNELKGYWTFENDTYDAVTKTFTNKGKLSTTDKASYVEVRGAGGENTSANEEVLLPAQINIEGNPAMSGTLPITTKATFEIPEAIVSHNGDVATAEFTKNGKYNVTLTLSNGWGSAQLTKNEYIVVNGLSGVEDNLVNNLSVYPNPFIDHVNLMFATDGNYTVELFDAQGRQLLSKKHQAMAGEVFTLDVDAEQGLYYVVVSKDGKRVNSFKVVAQ